MCLWMMLVDFRLVSLWCQNAGNMATTTTTPMKMVNKTSGVKKLHTGHSPTVTLKETRIMSVNYKTTPDSHSTVQPAHRNKTEDLKLSH